MPVLSPVESRKFLESTKTARLAGLRDWTLLSVMLYSFARAKAVLRMRRQEHLGQRSRRSLRLREKGGTRHDVPVHQRAAAALDAHMEGRGLKEPRAAFFQSGAPAVRRLTGRSLARRVVLAVTKRRAEVAGGPPSTLLPHVPGEGITAYLSNRGTPDHAQEIAGRASPKTTRLYDRTGTR